MNYRNAYNRIIRAAKRDNLQKLKIGVIGYQYLETHHIKPRALGGTNQQSNLVNLTAKQHYIVHHLLVKIYKRSKGRHSKEYAAMLTAFHFMQTCRKYTQFITARQYEKVRTEFGKLQHIRLSGKNNPSYGKKWMYNPITKQTIYCYQSECKKFKRLGFKVQSSKKGVKLSLAKRRQISKTHADVSGKKNPMYGKTIFQYMTKAGIKRWRKNIKNRKLKGKDNPSYGKKWITNLITDETLYVPTEELDSYLNMREWRLGVSDKKKRRMRLRISSKETQLKNLKTRYPNVDFSDFDFKSYSKLSKHGKYLYRKKFFK